MLARLIRMMLCCCVGAVALAAHAAAPQVKTSPPGVFRMMLGDFEITVLSDGTVALPFTTLLRRITKERAEGLLARAFLKDPVETSVNAFLINTGSKLVLIDTGAGTFFGPTLGRMLGALKASGYQPEQVDEIYITHLHGDHVGGLLADGKAAFPNAVVRVEKADADHWLSAAKRDSAAQDMRPAFEGAMAAIKPYADAGRFRPFEGDTALIPGVRAIVTRAHTPGHAIYAIESKGQKLVLWGDLMHLGAVQFADPTVTVEFDTDQSAAAQQRQKAFASAAKEGHWVGAPHLPFPGIGHLRAEGKGYVFVPVNYVGLP